LFLPVELSWSVTSCLGNSRLDAAPSPCNTIIFFSFGDLLPELELWTRACGSLDLWRHEPNAIAASAFVKVPASYAWACVCQ